MRAEVVQDDDIALGESWDKHLLDIDGEDVAVDRPVDDPRRVDAVAQGCDEGQRPPVPLLSLPAAATKPFRAQVQSLRSATFSQTQPQAALSGASAAMFRRWRARSRGQTGGRT
jgi:hypothetical protein